MIRMVQSLVALVALSGVSTRSMLGGRYVVEPSEQLKHVSVS